MTTPDNIKLIALDIDGTLLPPGCHHEALPDAVITDAIARLLDAEVAVALASGRMFPGTSHIAKHLGITLPLICQQGASQHDHSGAITNRFAIDPEIALELVAYARAEGWAFAWFDAERYLVSKANPASDHFAEVSGVSIELHDAPEHSGIVATGVDIISTFDHSNAIHRHLEDRFGDSLQLLDFPSVTAAHSPHASKGKALALLADELGIAQAQVLAIGDSVNDESMLEWAGHGAAPAHCDDYARAAANHILEGEGVDGVAALLQRLAERAQG